MDVNQKNPAVFYGWWVVVACFLIALYTGGVVFFGFTAVFEPIANEFGWDYAQVSVAASLRGLETGLLAPLMGLLVDRWGPRRLIFGGVICIGLGFVLLSRITSLGMFYGTFVLIAIGISTCSATVLMTAVVNWFRRKLGTAVGIMSSGFALSGLLVPLVALIIDTFGWRKAMTFFGLGMCVVGLPLSLLARHKPEQYGYLPDGEVGSNIAVGERLSSAQNIAVDIRLKQALTSRTFWHIALPLMCQSLAVSAVVTHVMPYLSSVGMARSLSSLVAGAVPMASAGGRLGFGWLGDRFENRRVAAGGFALMSLGLLFFSYISAGWTWLLVPFLILFGTGWGGCVSMRVALLREHFGRRRFGAVHGFTIGVMMVGVIVGAPLAGWVFDTWGSYQGIWFVYAAFTIAALVTVATTPPATSKTPLADEQSTA
ncbi:MFS transporter [Chloroflexota bacterium]